MNFMLHFMVMLFKTYIYLTGLASHSWRRAPDDIQNFLETEYCQPYTVPTFLIFKITLFWSDSHIFSIQHNVYFPCVVK